MRDYLVTLITVACFSCLHRFVHTHGPYKPNEATRQMDEVVVGVDASDMCTKLGYTLPAEHYTRSSCKIQCSTTEQDRPMDKQIFSLDGEGCLTDYGQEGTCIYGVCYPGPVEEFVRGDFVAVKFHVAAGKLEQQYEDNCRVLISYVSSPGPELKPFGYNQPICDLKTPLIKSNICFFRDSCILFPINRMTLLDVSISNEHDYTSGDLCKRRITLVELLDRGGKEISFDCGDNKVSMEINTYEPPAPSPGPPPPSFRSSSSLDAFAQSDIQQAATNLSERLRD